MGRTLGVDYGRRRIGLAVSDPTGFLSSSLRTETVQSDKEALARVLEARAETEAERIVLGHPLNMDGTRGELALTVEAFKAALEDQTEVPVVLWDERLTSKTAEDALIEAGTSRKKRKGLIDKLAAQIMLQAYLDAHPEAF